MSNVLIRIPRTRSGHAGRASLAHGSLLLLLAQVLGNLGFFLAVVLLARELSVADRGVVAFATTVAVIIPRVVELGMASSTTVLAAQRQEMRPNLLANSLAFAVSVGFFGAVAAGVILGVLGVGPTLDTFDLVCVGAGMLGTALVDGGYAFLVGVNHLRPWTAIAASAPWLYAAILAALATTGTLSVSFALTAWGLAHLAWGAAVFAVAARSYGIGRPRLDLLRDAMALGIRTWVGSLSRFLNFRLDQVLLGLIATQATLGLYATAVNLSEVALYLPGAVATAALAAIAREAVDRRHARTLEAFRVLFVLTLAIVVIGVALGAPLLPVVFGERYADAVVPYVILLPGALGYVASSIFSSALVSSVRPVLSSLGPLVSLMVGVVLDLALIPPLGATGAAIASTAAFGLGGIVAAIAYRTVSPFPAVELRPTRSDAATFVGIGRRGAAKFGGEAVARRLELVESRLRIGAGNPGHRDHAQP